jgi:hypothetical protein
MSSLLHSVLGVDLSTGSSLSSEAFRKKLDVHIANIQCVLALASVPAMCASSVASSRRASVRSLQYPRSPR